MAAEFEVAAFGLVFDDLDFLTSARFGNLSLYFRPRDIRETDGGGRAIILKDRRRVKPTCLFKKMN